LDNQRTYSDSLIAQIRKNLTRTSYKFITFPKLLFLCGKKFDREIIGDYAKTNRGVINNYIQARTENIFCILSEDCWDNKLLNEIDLLTFEEFLAEVSDLILLFVESMGSACELGAFSFKETSFCKKLLIVLDRKYENDESFINQGPIAKAKKHKSKVIYVDYDKALLMDRQIKTEIEKIIESSKILSHFNTRIINKDEKKIELNSFLIEIFEIIKLFQPIGHADIVELYKKIKGFNNFEFVKSNKKIFRNKILPYYILIFLKGAKLIEQDDNNNYTVPMKFMSQSDLLMFSFANTAMNRTRSRILARKFKYCDTYNGSK